jgi:MHS family proline/betaine transporter-like MFS transporter
MKSKSSKTYSIPLLSACLGNFFEHYDTALFGFLSVFLAPLIFPDKDPITALILTYAMIPLGMLARPIGALVFGYIGDRYGRRQALYITLMGMSVVSGCIALSPTYVQVGLLAPFIFTFGRILQNFFSSGESMGGAIYLLEMTPESKHDWISGLYNATTMAGILMSSAGVTLLVYYQSAEWGWRLLYLIGCLTGLFGYIIRRYIPTQNFDAVPLPPSGSHHFKMFWEYRKQLLMIAVGAGFSYANYSVALILMNGFIPLVSSVTQEEMMTLNTYLLVLDLCAIPFFGWLASKISRELLMLVASLAVVLCGIPLSLILPQATFGIVVCIRICLVLFGVAFFAPFHAWAYQLLPAQCRYAIISFGYALGTQLLGSPTAMISLWTFKQTGLVSSVLWYWFVLAILSSLALVYALPSYKNEQIASETV